MTRINFVPEPTNGGDVNADCLGAKLFFGNGERFTEAATEIQKNLAFFQPGERERFFGDFFARTNRRRAVENRSQRTHRPKKGSDGEEKSDKKINYSYHSKLARHERSRMAEERGFAPSFDGAPSRMTG